MKRFAMAGIVGMLLFAVTACGNQGASGKARTSIEAVTKYLSTANGGASVDDPVPLAVKIDLQNTLADESGWKQLLGAINTVGKYVALDLSGCTMPGTEFNPDPKFADGKKFIVSLVLPDTVVNIAEGGVSGSNISGVFEYFASMSGGVPIGKNFTTIGKGAFANNQLTGTLTIPDGVTTIGNSAFIGNITSRRNELSSVTIPDSVTSIGGGAFSHNRLTSVTIPDSVTSIEYSAFSYNHLTSVIIPDSVTSIGNSAFSHNRLTSVTIGNSVTSIGSDAFGNNYGQLTSITIPDSVTEIGTWAFNNNRLTLTSITIGANVQLVHSHVIGNSFLSSIGDGFENVYNNNGRQAGTYTRPNTSSTTWTRQRSGGQAAASEQDQAFLSELAGTWKRDTFNNTLTITANSVKSSSQSYYWTIVSLSAGTLTICDEDDFTVRLNIRLVNDDMEISGDSGNGDNNWNGTWKKQE